MKGELFPVSDLVRKAASDYALNQIGLDAAAERIRRGGMDDHFLVQSFARFERDHLSDLTAQLDKAREALRPFAVMGRMLDGPFAPALFKDADPIGMGGAWRENGETRTITFGDLRRAARACLPATSGDVG